MAPEIMRTALRPGAGLDPHEEAQLMLPGDQAVNASPRPIRRRVDHEGARCELASLLPATFNDHRFH